MVEFATNRAAAMCQMTESLPTYRPNYDYMGPCKCHDSHGESGFKIAWGCMLPAVAGAFSPDRQQKLG